MGPPIPGCVPPSVVQVLEELGLERLGALEQIT